MTDPRRDVPRTDALLADPRVAAARAALGEQIVRHALTSAQDEVRRGCLAPADTVTRALDLLPRTATRLRRVLNATGVVVHTNLGRAPLSAAAREALLLAAGTTDLELDLATGRRGPRAPGTRDALLDALGHPPGVGALVLNNGAAALLLAITASLDPAAGRVEVVVSRGELVEIGDGFRLPDLLVTTGAALREVGTTNRTHRADVADAIGPRTAAVLRVHPSNFTVSGFTATVPLTELADLCRDHEVPLVVDLGSGLLQPHPALPDEPDAATALAAGAHLVTASGDKLLGGPQCGLLLGDADRVEHARRHPLARALRPDKLTLAALEATLRGPQPPVQQALSTDPTALRRRAQSWADRLDATVVPHDGSVGGGGAPGVPLPGWAVALPEALAGPLRAGTPAVLGRVHRGALLLDPRTVDPADDADLLAAVHAARSRP